MSEWQIIAGCAALIWLALAWCCWALFAINKGEE